MRCLITGGAGFLASHLAQALLHQHHDVLLIDNFSPEYDPAIKRRNARGTGAPLIEADISDAPAITRALRDHRIEAIFHLAALPGVRLSVQEPLRCTAVNVQGTTTLLEAARQTGVSKFIFTSSSSVYGLGLPMPFLEDATPTRPISPYAASKLAGEHLCHAYAHLYNIQTVILRLFTVYGPRQRPDLAFHKFIHAITSSQPIPVYGDGNTRRDYTYCADAVTALVAALEFNTPFDTFNIASGRAVTLNEVITAIESATGRVAIRHTLPAQPGDVDATFADIGKARQLLHYNPKTTLREGIENQVAWHRELHR